MTSLFDIFLNTFYYFVTGTLYHFLLLRISQRDLDSINFKFQTSNFKLQISDLKNGFRTICPIR